MKRKSKKVKRTNVCQWCGRDFPNATEHMVHVHEAHPDKIGSGRSMSKNWACLDVTCGHDNPPTSDECVRCGRQNPTITAQNAARGFIVCRRRSDGTVWRSHITSAFAARYTIEAQVVFYRDIYGRTVTHDKRRHEIIDPVTLERLAWTELAVVEETSNYTPGKDRP